MLELTRKEILALINYVENRRDYFSSLEKETSDLDRLQEKLIAGLLQVKTLEPDASSDDSGRS